MSEKIKLETEFITLGQLLKDAGVISTGGQAKWFLKENSVLLNGSPEDRRGKKLRSGDVVVVGDQTFEIE
ncbi:S4 domain-containing protein YaaA [Companilactobacillus suantsaicola]|jgi:S4 domain protein YaaA|uniref:S4 domain-containing protein YaaA n=1 Tax=Companilactobacillus suantsaicola TaxID=2487723 RepID=A0A4Z0JF89_9LACO|nr:S4 domain-containing protein YaaA [Companilactobacillus suantsaicola]TGD21408.1 S4 domain-containing protein YaaA [Companilactobacillus suantsaicola]